MRSRRIRTRHLELEFEFVLESPPAGSGSELRELEFDAVLSAGQPIRAGRWRGRWDLNPSGRPDLRDLAGEVLGGMSGWEGRRGEAEI